MFEIPESSEPEFVAFVAGFFLPWLSAAFGFAVNAVIRVLRAIDRNSD